MVVFCQVDLTNLTGDAELLEITVGQPSALSGAEPDPRVVLIGDKPAAIQLASLVNQDVLVEQEVLPGGRHRLWRLAGQARDRFDVATVGDGT